LFPELELPLHPESSESSANNSAVQPHSPIQEHHIDFLLEEEFACNPQFLAFFLKAAQKNMSTSSDGAAQAQFMQAHEEWNCRAIRSVTTHKGETDVLVTYKSVHEARPRVAILIEDKIRAEFQKEQAERYKDRGDAGEKAGDWDYFWTCLVAPEKYAKNNMGFDTRISLETLMTFFSGQDQRTHFKAAVIERSLQHFAATGMQIVDKAMTEFRTFYAHEAEIFFKAGEVVWEQPRDAWRDDQWFSFKGGLLPTGCKVIYKAKKGSIELECPGTNVGSVKRVQENCSHDSRITAEQSGKRAFFQIEIEKIFDFENPAAAQQTMVKSLQGVRALLMFYRANAGEIATTL
jgi:hypothetical protein